MKEENNKIANPILCDFVQRPVAAPSTSPPFFLLLWIYTRAKNKFCQDLATAFKAQPNDPNAASNFKLHRLPGPFYLATAKILIKLQQRHTGQPHHLIQHLPIRSLSTPASQHLPDLATSCKLDSPWPPKQHDCELSIWATTGNNSSTIYSLFCCHQHHFHSPAKPTHFYSSQSQSTAPIRFLLLSL